MIGRIFIVAGLAFICCWLIRINSDMADMASDIMYIKNWVAGQSLTTNAFDIVRAIEKAKSDLMVEMACIGAKNNADIQRVKDGFQVGDVFEAEGCQYLVLERMFNDDNFMGYRVVCSDDLVIRYASKEWASGAKLVRHDSWFDKIAEEAG